MSVSEWQCVVVSDNLEISKLTGQQGNDNNWSVSTSTKGAQIEASSLWNAFKRALSVQVKSAVSS
jgi:hypothetical protein